MPLFIILLTIPLIEIGLFVVIGGEIGLWPTLAVVLLTAIIGATAIRSQGRSVMQDLNRINDPKKVSEAMLTGAFIIVAGLLLLTPGFLTDTIGLLLLAPPVRAAIARHAAARMQAAAMRGAASGGVFWSVGGAAGGAARPQPSPQPSNDDAPPAGLEGPRKPSGRPMPDADDAVIVDRPDEPRP